MFKKSNFNIFWFLCIYAFLALFFYAYIGIISPGGKGYSPFLHSYLDFPAWLTYIICQGAKGLLKLMGYNVYQKALNNVTIRGSRGINIIWACLGLKVLSFWTAFIVAHRATWQYKLKWVGIGVSAITLLNIFRIASIALANHYDWKAYQTIEPHFAFNVASYIVILIFMLWFTVVYKRYSNARQKITSRR